MHMNKLYLGLDVHKDSITLALAQDGRTGEFRLYGTITHSPQFSREKNVQRRRGC